MGDTSRFDLPLIAAPPRRHFGNSCRRRACVLTFRPFCRARLHRRVHVCDRVRVPSHIVPHPGLASAGTAGTRATRAGSYPNLDARPVGRTGGRRRVYVATGRHPTRGHRPSYERYDGLWPHEVVGDHDEHLRMRLVRFPLHCRRHRLLAVHGGTNVRRESDLLLQENIHRLVEDMCRER